MIAIEVKKANKVKDHTESMFISFAFDMKKVEKVKSLPVRYYDGFNKSWEVPVSEINKVIELFEGEEVKISLDNVVTKEATTKANNKEEKEDTNIKYSSKISTKFRFKTNPFDHQIEGFNYAIDNTKFLLGDEQGLGKTKQAIDIAVSRKYSNKFKHCLIICGVNSLKFNWMKEVKVHSNESAKVLGTYKTSTGKIKEGSVKQRLEDLTSGVEEFFLITNVETLRDKEVASKLKEMTENGTIGMVIIDEIHKCKNARSQQGKAIHNLKSYFKMALTGTPLMNQPIDLFNILKWLEVEKGAYYSFEKRYCVKGGYGGYEIVGYKNLDELQKKLESVMLRRKKEEVLSLPPKIRSTEYVEMTAKQAKIYREIKDQIKANLKDIELSPNPLAQLIRLRQATASTAILSDKIKESAKIDRLKEMVEELAESGQKAIIFSNWTDVTDLVIPELASYNPAVITGKTTDREEQVEKFMNDDSCKVIVGTIGAMGTGLTLTKASTVIFMDKPWNMANTEQAEDRAHRIGTTGTVNIVTLVCKDTIDERIEEIIAEKAEMAKGLVEGDFDILAKLGKSELVDRLLG